VEPAVPSGDESTVHTTLLLNFSDELRRRISQK
jgi:hypothetical protein